MIFVGCRRVPPGRSRRVLGALRGPQRVLGWAGLVLAWGGSRVVGGGWGLLRSLGKLPTAQRDAPNIRIHAPSRSRIDAPNIRIEAPNRFRIQTFHSAYIFK